MPRTLATVVTALAMLLGGASAEAAVLVPTRTDDPVTGGDRCVEAPTDCSLRRALEAAAPGDAIDLRAGPPGPYAVTQDGALPLGVSLFLIGAGPGRTVLARTAGTGPVLSIAPSAPKPPPAESDPDSPPGPREPPPPTPSPGGARSPRVLVRDLTVTGGEGRSTAGGIAIAGAEAALVRLAVTGNASRPREAEEAGVGAGILAFRSRVTLAQSSVTSNVATSGGRGGIAGGVYTSDGPFRVVASTVAGNVADRGGGFYQAAGDSSISLEHATVVGNRARRGGNLFLFSGTLTAADSIVAQGVGSPGLENCAGDGSVVTASQGHNLESPSTQCGFDAPGDLQGVSEPGLGALRDEGDGTFTVPLTPGSPAIGAAAPDRCDAPTGDQRGRPRTTAGGCDTGALESGLERTTAPGCRVLGEPRVRDERLVASVRCGAARRVRVRGALALGRSGGSATSAVGPATVRVRRAARRTVRLRLSASQRRQVRAAKAQSRSVRSMVSLTSRAAR